MRYLLIILGILIATESYAHTPHLILKCEIVEQVEPDPEPTLPQINTISGLILESIQGVPIARVS